MLFLVVADAREVDAQRADGSGRQFRLALRADAFLARVDAFHAGLGATTDLGSYVRVDAVVAGGVARDGDESVASGRLEVTGRFLLDPFRQSRWGFYGGAGLIARHDDGAETNGYLTLIAGTELPGSGRMLPALEIGIGGGTRFAFVLRRSRPSRR